MTISRKPRRLLAGLAAGTLVLAACGSDDNGDADEAVEEEAPAEEAGTIVDVAVGAGDFTTLVAAVEAAGLVETLSGDGPFTVFAPTDEAFAALPDGLVEALLLPENQDALTAILTYHVVAAEVPSSAVEAGPVETVQGEEAEIVVDGDTITIAGATITATDIEASNGVIHVIDQVIVPPSIDPAALLADDSMEDEDAMDDDAMDDEAMEDDAMEEESAGTIVDIAAGNEAFSTLVAAVDAAGLVETLSGDGPFTVFAPTNDAFDALPDGLLDALLLEENADLLTAVLTYHVLGAEVPSSDVASGAVTTVQGEDAEIVADGDTLTIAGANIVDTDIEADNGVIHVIDAVIVPPSIDQAALLALAAGEDAAAGDEAAAEEPGTIIEVAEEAGIFNTLLAAGEAAGINEVLNAPGEYTIFAPTDEAFDALPDGLVDALLLEENSEALTAILTYHAVLGTVPAADVEAGPLTMLQGEDAEIVVGDDGITIAGANIVETDVFASNGVIHVIDAVIVPPSIDPAALLG